MSSWTQLPDQIRDADETVHWQGKAGVTTAAVVGSTRTAIDKAGASKGVVVLTDRRLTIGHVRGWRAGVVVWDSFPLEVLQVLQVDSRGVAIRVLTVNPIDVVVVTPDASSVEDLVHALHRSGMRDPTRDSRPPIGDDRSRQNAVDTTEPASGQLKTDERFLADAEVVLVRPQSRATGWFVLTNKRVWWGQEDAGDLGEADELQPIHLSILNRAELYTAGSDSMLGRGEIGMLLHLWDGSSQVVILKENAANKSFCVAVATWIQVWNTKRRYAELAAEHAPLLAEVEEMRSIREELAEIDDAPDEELNALAAE